MLFCHIAHLWLQQLPAASAIAYLLQHVMALCLLHKYIQVVDVGAHIVVISKFCCSC